MFRKPSLKKDTEISRGVGRGGGGRGVKLTALYREIWIWICSGTAHLKKYPHPRENERRISHSIPY